MKLYGLKDKDGKEYEVTLPDMTVPNAIDNRTFKLGELSINPVEPEKKKLPKTKKEFNTFLGLWANRHTATTEEFLNDYEDI